MQKIKMASNQTGIKEIAIAGGVSANSGLRKALQGMQEIDNWNVFIPKPEYSTDNAAMIAITGYLKFLKKDFASHSVVPYARSSF
jgi:N6-L-threonylcarbamoyladenine synthase